MCARTRARVAFELTSEGEAGVEGTEGGETDGFDSHPDNSSNKTPTAAKNRLEESVAL